MNSTHRRNATATGALLAAAALLTVGVQAGSASAQPGGSANPAAAKGQPRNPGALPAQLTPSQRAELIAKAQSTTAATAKELGLGAQEKLLVRDVVKDQDGTTHTRYERTYEGLPVLGGDLVVNRTSADRTQSVSKASNAQLQGVSTSAPADAPATASAKALDAAKAVGSKADKADIAPRKVVWMANGVPTLAYETVIGGLQDDGTPNQLHVITDAKTGAKLHQWQGIETGVGNTHYSGQVTLGTSKSGTNFTMNDTGRGGHKTYNLNHGTSGTGSLFSQATDTWGNGANSNAATAGADAAYGAGVTWDFYKNVFGRSGIRGDGVAAYSRVHYGNAYVNAFWDDSCFCMTYGDGAGNNDPLTSLDVAGHEMSHGVTAATAGLEYSNESGGLNEATSDIMGTSVEFYANNPSDPGDYLIGEKIDINGDGTPLRYMDKPSKDGGSADAWYSGVGNLDVHYSSGPANHWFYLASEGSGAKTINGVNYNSPTSDGLPVTGIGRDKAQLIWYKALTTKFNSTTDYAGARAGTIAAATELYGAGSAEVNAVTDAWAAVNVGARSGGGNPNPGNVFESTTQVAIPDSPGPAVTSSVAVTGITGNAPSTLKVGVKITHTYVGDLQIDLVAPNGTTFRLQNSSSDSTANLDKTYTVNASAVAANGTWKLKVQDKAAADTGTITDFKLTF
ncbi:Zn-dependent metalloprotease [Streptomyces sp. 3211.6]|uniref:M4 family metallopeptidase n=1 Tax=Streptomyces TaxID=1883 RepID=UPI0009A47EE1|nr:MULTISPECIES: M4 family metallopeptidase [Streptomyces]RKT08566.1 Zn-dependent metalloprotease [Streptomyces sp. 3211.6]RPF29963.1 Zn-dependent metalloprotease [Streptomyces sp. Ag109_G2-6]